MIWLERIVLKKQLSETLKWVEKILKKKRKTPCRTYYAILHGVLIELNKKNGKTSSFG